MDNPNDVTTASCVVGSNLRNLKSVDFNFPCNSEEAAS